MLHCLVQGWRGYSRDNFNNFDAFIVIMSFVELAVAPPSFISPNAAVSGGAISALRTFRLTRLFKLARSWTSLQQLLQTLYASFSDIGNFLLLLVLFMYIYTLLGMQLYANRFRFDGDSGIAVVFDPAVPENGYLAADHPRAHFDSFLWGFVTVFQILTGENWNAGMVVYCPFYSISSHF